MRPLPLLFLFACVPTDDSSLAVSAGDLYDVDVTVEPDPPTVGDLRLRAEITEMGTPVSGCALHVGASMPEHGHGAMDVPVATEDGDGVYTIAWRCPMSGHWEITMDLDCPEGEDHVVIDLDVA